MCLQCRSGQVQAKHTAALRRKRPSRWAGCIGPVVTWKGIVVMGVERGTRRVFIDPANLPDRVKTVGGWFVEPVDLNEWQGGAGWDKERVKRYQKIIGSFVAAR